MSDRVFFLVLFFGFSLLGIGIYLLGRSLGLPLF